VVSFTRTLGTGWIVGWAGTLATLDELARKKKNPIVAPTRNRNPVVHPVS